MKKGLKIGLGVLAGIVVVGAIAGRQEAPKSSGAPAPPVAATSAAQQQPEPEPEPGITMADYQQLRTGMTYPQVVAILGEEGEELSSNEIAGTRTVMYQWRAGAFGGNMNAMFQDGKLIQKAQFGLR